MSDLNNKYKHYMDVGKLLDFIDKNNIPRDANILVERIEDVYFDNHNWETIRRKDSHNHEAIRMNEAISKGEFDPSLQQLNEEELEKTKTHYIVTYYPVKYDDDNNLYLDIHH